MLNITDAENVPQTYTKVRKKIDAMIDNLEGQFQSSIDAIKCKDAKNNPKMFWLHVHSKLKAKSWHGTLSTEQNG